jgi:hypothetical protein
VFIFTKLSYNHKKGFLHWIRLRDRETERQIDRKTERERDRETERERDRETEKQRHRETESYQTVFLGGRGGCPEFIQGVLYVELMLFFHIAA